MIRFVNIETIGELPRIEDVHELAVYYCSEFRLHYIIAEGVWASVSPDELSKVLREHFEHVFYQASKPSLDAALTELIQATIRQQVALKTFTDLFKD